MYELQKNRWLKHIDFAIADILTLECLYLVLVNFMISKREWNRLGVHKQVAVAIPIISILLYTAYDFHKNILRRSAMMELAAAFNYACFVSGSILVYLYLSKDAWKFSRRLFIVFFILSVPCLFAVRMLYKRILVRVAARRTPALILVTDRAVTEETVGAIETGDMRCHLSAIFCAGGQAPFPEVFPLEETLFENYRNTQPIDEVILDLTDEALYRKWAAFLLDSGLTIHIRIDELSKGLPNTMIEQLGDMTVVSASNSVAYPGQLILKRLMDIAGSLVGLFFTFIAFLIFGPVIKIQSPGPVFYSQIRVGRNGRQFRIYKFRSMYPDADARKKELMENNKMSGQMFKVEDDPRIFPVGRFMRKHSIDEMPQFLNVLKGDMSLVGTRPPTLDEWERYSPHHRARLSAKPGLTGMWQVSGRNDITDFEEVVRMDTEYINNWSLLTDVKLLFKTVAVIFTGKGAS